MWLDVLLFPSMNWGQWGWLNPSSECVVAFSVNMQVDWFLGKFFLWSSTLYCLHAQLLTSVSLQTSVVLAAQVILAMTGQDFPQLVTKCRIARKWVAKPLNDDVFKCIHLPPMPPTWWQITASQYWLLGYMVPWFSLHLSADSVFLQLVFSVNSAPRDDELWSTGCRTFPCLNVDNNGWISAILWNLGSFSLQFLTKLLVPSTTQASCCWGRLSQKHPDDISYYNSSKSTWWWRR